MKNTFGKRPLQLLLILVPIDIAVSKINWEETWDLHRFLDKDCGYMQRKGYVAIRNIMCISFAIC